LRLAAIDLGSNAARLLVVKVVVEEGGNPNWKAIEYIRVPVRLGDDVFLTGKVGAVRRQQLLETMKGFSFLLKAYEVDHCLACATSALREATNGSEIIDSILRDSGIRMELISGPREAELIYKAHRSLAGPNEQLVLMDVGGGSTEISLIQGQRSVLSKSFTLGAVRILDKTDREQDWKTFKDFIKGELLPFKPSAFWGSGGNINKVFDLLRPGKGEPCTYKQLDKFYEQLALLSPAQRAFQYGLNEDRADVIVPALRLFLWVMKQADYTKLYNSKLGLKEGMIVHLLEKNWEGALHSMTAWRPGPWSDTTHLSTAE
jgi:exopolyphosphatase/guanosine-5'-triphosphate,3'-diphosphate pyrophosphatase